MMLVLFTVVSERKVKVGLKLQSLLVRWECRRKLPCMQHFHC